MTEEQKPKRLKPRKGHEERLDAILKEYGMEIDEAADAEGETPFDIMGARADQLELSVEELMEEDVDFLRSSSYPGEDCLEPYEVELFLAARLSKERRSHAEDCSGCKALLAALTRPRREGFEELRQTIRETSGKVTEKETSIEVPAAEDVRELEVEA
jgi:hypothetical protein